MWILFPVEIERPDRDGAVSCCHFFSSANLWIYREGLEWRFNDVETGQRGRRGFSHEQVEAVEKEGERR